MLKHKYHTASLVAHPRVRVRVRVRVTVRVTVTVRWGLLPTTSHSILYSRVGQIVIFSHCQPLDWEDT